MVDTTELLAKLDAHAEWLLVGERGRAFSLARREIEVIDDAEKPRFGFIDDTGTHSWRLNGVAFVDDEIAIDVAGAFGRGQQTLKLVPRTPASVLAAEIEIARLKAANEIADTLTHSLPNVRLSRVSLNADGGRLAQIQFDLGDKTPRAALADVTGVMSHESLMTAALLWLEKLGTRKKPVNDLYLLCEKRAARNAQKLHAMLNSYWKAKITVAEIDRRAEPPVLKIFPTRAVNDLWREKQKRFVLPETQIASRVSTAVTALAPDETDIIYSKQGETVRFRGLPFVRVRTMLGREKAWFGAGRPTRPLTDETWDDLSALIDELREYRVAEPSVRRHELYRRSSEAWLESLLRRDITQLDANLTLSPIYSQFRASSDKIDLLALRRDGRLVVIELKTQPDREMVFQAADYWRKIELQRRRGDLAAARLFGNLRIADEPAIIYLAAPAWSFHRDFEFFARSLAPDIELWRFDLHETWRETVKVVARNRYSDDILKR